MDPHRLKSLLADVAAGTVAPDAAYTALADYPVANLDFARLDTHRAVRTAWPEVVYGAGKTPEQLAAIVDRLALNHDRVLATRCSPEGVAAVLAVRPEAVYHPLPRAITLGHRAPEAPRGTIALFAAGTADLPVAEEAALTAELADVAVRRVWDVGVAGLHRLLDQRHQLAGADVVVVVAGMEGALPSVVGGLTELPVIAVPTSVGYGASFGGLAALLGMLNSCAAGVAVVNIDNGFGAGHLAARIARQRRDG